jgi:RNA recognition motif-containing protein
LLVGDQTNVAAAQEGPVVPEPRPVAVSRLPSKIPPRHAPPNSQKSAIPDKPMDRADRSVYVSNIPYKATRQDISEVFSQFGPVASVTIPFDSLSGLVRGYAFVDFAAPEGAQAALGSRVELFLHGRLLHVGPSRRGSH